jgi:hypothetical protein
VLALQVLRDADGPPRLVATIGKVAVSADPAGKDVDVVVVGVAMAHGGPLERVGVQALGLGHALHVVGGDPLPLVGVQLLALGQR